MPKVRWYAVGLVVAFCIFFVLGGFDIWHTLQSAATKAAAALAAILSLAKVAQEAIDDEYHTMGRDVERGLWERVW